MSDKILVTGASGFIGGYLSNHLLEKVSYLKTTLFEKNPSKNLPYLKKVSYLNWESPVK